LEKTRNAHRVLVKKSLGKQLLEWMVNDIKLDTGTLVVIREVNGRD
jgi:hypothetical protein